MNDETPVWEDLSLRDPAPQHDRQVTCVPQKNMSLRSESFHVDRPKWATVDAWSTSNWTDSLYYYMRIQIINLQSVSYQKSDWRGPPTLSENFSDTTRLASGS